MIEIMSGDEYDLQCVSYHLNMNAGIISRVERKCSGIAGVYAVLVVDDRKEDVARLVAENYVNREAVRTLRVCALPKRTPVSESVEEMG